MEHLQNASGETQIQVKENAIDNFMLTRICFGVNFAVVLIHLATLATFKKARQIYGIGYFIGQIFFGLSSLLTLICCSLAVESRAFHLIQIGANFGYLFNISAQLFSILSAFVVSCHLPNQEQTFPSPVCPSPERSPNLMRKTWMNAISLFCLLGFPLSMTVQHAFERPGALVLAAEKNSAIFTRTCSFLPTATTLYFLLIPATALLLIQLVLVCVALRWLETKVSLGKGLKCQQRLMAALKTCLGQLLTWGMALIAVVWGSSPVWRIFAICLAMQSIFCATVCILSRSVIGAALSKRNGSNGPSGERMIVHKYEN